MQNDQNLVSITIPKFGPAFFYRTWTDPVSKAKDTANVPINRNKFFRGTPIWKNSQYYSSNPKELYFDKNTEFFDDPDWQKKPVKEVDEATGCDESTVQFVGFSDGDYDGIRMIDLRVNVLGFMKVVLPTDNKEISKAPVEIIPSNDRILGFSGEEWFVVLRNTSKRGAESTLTVWDVEQKYDFCTVYIQMI
jgi:hypothetical protein